MPDDRVTIPRPKRWDVPFDPDMTDVDVDRVLAIEPFASIDPEKFPPSSPLRGIIQNDCRVVQYQPGDLIVRAGDYGHSLFYIISGAVRVVLKPPLSEELLGRRKSQRTGFLRAVAQLWTNRRTVEHRDVSSYQGEDALRAQRGEGSQTRVFLQDVPAIIDEHRTAEMVSGAFFGELAALGRIPRTATVFAETGCELLELRWQGFRDLRRRADEIRAHVDAIYRKRALVSHLRKTPLFKHCTLEQLNEVADQTALETYGEFDWYASYKEITEADPTQRLAHEPVIAEEGHYPNGVIIVRAGFARQSRRYGNGERTVSYLGAGHVYGLDEVAHNAHETPPIGLQSTLRALGYVDVLRVPTVMVEKYALPAAKPMQIAPTIDSGLLEFLVENRHINGSAAMIIDLDRCTRCDDCVRACADAHDNNPRFVRHGPTFGRHMVANACMHCADPVCMIGCPTGAIHRDLHGGQVVINDLTCIGCATCANSCPYDNIRMVEIRDDDGIPILDERTRLPVSKATKCDLCVDQLGGPACQRACPHDALIRTDLAALKAQPDWDWLDR